MTEAPLVRIPRRWSALFGVCALLAAAGCEADSPPQTTSPSAGSTARVADPSTTYASTAFVLPFDVTRPDWLPTEAMVDQPNFVTGESTDGTRAVRFLVPVSVYEPGSSEPTPVPPDYLSYLLDQVDQGGAFTDVTETSVGGRPATVVTATTENPIDGALGCPDDGLTAGDCYGLQPDLVLRLAVVDVDEGPLLIWLRSSRDADPEGLAADVADFEAMLASVSFSDRSPDAPVVSSGTATAIDGSWTATWSRDELAAAPLLDADELNDSNWGEFTLTFDHGSVEQSQENVTGTYPFSGTYDVEGDVLAITLENGERFTMRWQLDGDQLTFVRDESLGLCPTPFVIEPWIRQDELSSVGLSSIPGSTTAIVTPVPS